MKLSTKGRYGVRLMIDLAAHYGEGPVLLREIAERQEISEKYLSNLINPLRATVSWRQLAVSMAVTYSGGHPLRSP